MYLYNCHYFASHFHTVFLIKMLETSKKILLTLLSQTHANISQVHNNMHLQINMNFTKNTDMGAHNI